MTTIRTLLLTTLVLAFAGVGCGDDDDAGSAGKGGSSGKGASAGKGDTAGSDDEAGTGSSAGTSGKASGAGGSGGAKAGTGGGAGAAGTKAGSGGAAGGGSGSMKLTSSAVMAGEMLPAKYRCQGGISGEPGPSPALSWQGAPDGTKSFALLLRDRTFNNYQHWTIYDIPSSVTSLPEMVPTGAMPDMPTGAKQANNSSGLKGPGYFGPCGMSGVNMYEFVLYALDVETLPMPGMTGASVEAVAEMHDLAKASLMIKSGP